MRGRRSATAAAITVLMLCGACSAGVAEPSLASPATAAPTTAAPTIVATLAPADRVEALRSMYAAMDRGDFSATTAAFTGDAEVSMPWLILQAGRTCCTGSDQIRSALQGSLSRDHGFTVLSLALDGDGVAGRVEARTQLTADPRLGRAILIVAATFAGGKIARLDQRFDASDPITERAVRYKAVVAASNAAPTPSFPIPPFTPAWREVTPPANGIVANTLWIELDAAGDHKLLAAVQRPSGPGPFPVVVLFHGGGGLNRPLLLRFFDKGYVSAGFMVVVGCWFDGDNPQNPPAPQPIRCPNAPTYESTYGNRVQYAAALVETARVLPGAAPGRLGVFGESQGATEVVLLASTGTQMQAVVADSAPYSQGFSARDTRPIDIVGDLAAPLLMLEGLVPDPSGRALPSEAQDYEAALKKLGKPYQAIYYPGVSHDPGPDSGANPVVRDDARAQAIAFFKKYFAAR